MGRLVITNLISEKKHCETYEGYLNECKNFLVPCAIKKINKEKRNFEKELQNITEIYRLNQPQRFLLNYFGFEEENDFFFFAFEKCEMNLFHFTSHYYWRPESNDFKWREENGTFKRFCFEIIEALSFLHKNQFVHCNIHPGYLFSQSIIFVFVFTFFLFLLLNFSFKIFFFIF